jgi:AcrR family transcriptional regulator
MNGWYVSAMGRRAGVTAVETRGELLAATMTVLLARGYEGTRVSMIAQEAGLTSGAIYNHFSSKAELLTAAIVDQGPGAISDLMRSGDGMSVIDVFRQIGRVLPEHSGVMGPLMLDLIATSTRDTEVAEVVRGQFADREHDAADALRLGQDAGAVDAGVDVEALTRFTTMLALGSIVTAALELKPVDETAWSAVVDRMLNAITPKGNTS